MPTNPRNDNSDENSILDFSILELHHMGGKMYGEFTEEGAIELFMKFHPEANETDVRAELTRGLEAIAEETRQHKARIERERAQKAE